MTRDEVREEIEDKLSVYASASRSEDFQSRMARAQVEEFLVELVADRKFQTPKSLERGRVYHIDYASAGRDGQVMYASKDRDGQVMAYWTGEIDSLGRVILRPCDGRPPFHLFEHEIQHMEKV